MFECNVCELFDFKNNFDVVLIYEEGQLFIYLSVLSIISNKLYIIRIISLVYFILQMRLWIQIIKYRIVFKGKVQVGRRVEVFGLVFIIVEFLGSY